MPANPYDLLDAPASTANPYDALDEVANPYNKLDRVSPVDDSHLKVSPYEKIQLEHPEAREGLQNGTEFLTGIARNPKSFLTESFPGLIAAPFAAAGSALNAGAQDVGAVVGGNPEGFGNVSALLDSSRQPYEDTLRDISASHPKTAIAGKVASGLVQSAPMMAAGLPAGAIGKLIALGFTADMIKSGGAAAAALGDELGKNPEARDMDKVTTAISELTQSGVFASSMGAHALKGIAEEAGKSLVDKYAPRGQGIGEVMKPNAKPLSVAAPNPYDALDEKSDMGIPITETPRQQPTEDDILSQISQGKLATEQRTAEVAASKPAAEMLAEKPDVTPANIGEENFQRQTIAEKAAANPNAAPTMADLASLESLIKGNQLKPKETPSELSTDDTTNSNPPATELAPAAPVESNSDFERYGELTASLKGKTMDEAQLVMQEIEAIKNRSGGMTPTENAVKDEAPNYNLAILSGDGKYAYVSQLGKPETTKQVSANTPAELIKVLGSKYKLSPTPKDSVFKSFDVANKEWDQSKSIRGTAKKLSQPTVEAQKETPAQVVTPTAAPEKSSIYEKPKNSVKPTGVLGDGDSVQPIHSDTGGVGASQRGLGARNGVQEGVESGGNLPPNESGAGAGKSEKLPNGDRPENKFEQLALKLEGLKTGVAKGGQLHAFGLAADLWDRAVSIAQGVIRAGGSIAEAITAAIAHIKENHRGEFDEKATRAALGAVREQPEGASPANKYSALEREALGLPERETPERQSREQVVAEAEQIMSKQPPLAANLVDEITATPRELKPWEQVVFLRHVVDLKKSLESAREDVFQSKQNGESPEVAALHAQELSDKIYAAVDAFEKSGTPTARALQFRNTLMKEDYSVESLEMTARAARGGERLTESELAKIKEQSDEIHATQQKIDEEQKAAAEREAEEASAHAHAEMVRQAEKEPWHAFSPEVMKQAQGIADRMKAKADKSREALRAMGIRFNVGIDPTAIYHLAVVGADHAVRFSIKSAEWANAMVGEFGEGIREHLPKIAAATEKIFKQEGGDKIPKPRTKKGEPVDTKATIDSTLTAIHEAIDSGETPKDFSVLIRSLAKRAVEGGVRDRNKLVDAVHKMLKGREIEISREETRDAISGYGDYRQLSKAEVDVELRRMKAELQKVAQIEALEQGQSPLKSGMEHGKLSDDARRMVQRINELKKQLGITVGDPETQLKSALASKKTRLNNQIRDLEHEIATREKIVRERGASPTDAETDILIKKRDELKAVRDEIFSGTMSDAQRLALSERAAQRSLDDWNKKLADAQKGKFDLAETKRDVPASVKLEAARAARDAAKAEFEYLKDLSHPELAEQAAAAKRRASLEQSIANYSDKLARSDFSTRPKPKPNPKLFALEAQKKRVFETYRAANKKAMLARRPRWVRGIEAIPKYITQAALSGPLTLIKLLAASVEQGAMVPLDDIVGSVINRAPVLRGIAEGGVNQGGRFSPTEYGKAWAKAFTLGISDARKILNLSATAKPIGSYLKGWATLDKAKREAALTESRNVPHTSDLDEQWGKPGHGRSSLEFFGLLHGAEKAVLKRFVFEYNLARGKNWAERTRQNPDDPIVAARIGLEAYKAANRAVFLEDNRATDAFQSGLARLSEPAKVTTDGKENLRYPLIGTVAAAGIRAQLPVVKVAANILAQAFERMGGGLPMAAHRILTSKFNEGLGKMPAEERDVVIGNLKRGAVGLAFLAYGYFNYQNMGAFYNPSKKRKEGDLQPGEMRLGGHVIDKHILDNPAFLAMQVGGSLHQFKDSKIRKKDTDAMGWTAASEAAAMGLIDTSPFTHASETLNRLGNQYQREGAVNRMASSFVPQLIQQPARWMDKDASGEVVKREPTNLLQSLEMGIPGLRQNVPEKKK